MTEEKHCRLHTVYGILLSALCGLSGLSLIVSCILLYLSGDAPFTRASVTAALTAVAVPLVLCVLGVIFSAVVSIRFPMAAKRLRGAVKPSVLIDRLLLKLPREKCDTAFALSVMTERKKRFLSLLLPSVISALFLIPVIVYFTDLSHFTVENLNGDVIAASLFILPFLAVSCLLFLAASFFCKASLDRELSLVKTRISEPALENAVTVAPETLRKRNAFAFLDTRDATVTLVVRVAVLAVAAVFIVLGVLNGGMNDVLEKAVRICTECIGLG